jgi:hypothetical protein
MPSVVASFYDSDNIYERTRALTLWSDGDLTYTERESPGDVWPVATVTARGMGEPAAMAHARALGLVRGEGAPPAGESKPANRCPGCGRVMSPREASEQGECNDCHPGGAFDPNEYAIDNEEA